MLSSPPTRAPARPPPVVGKILWHLGLDVGVSAQTGEPIRPCPVEHRIRLDQLAAITFTEKAAYDLGRKLRQEIGRHAPEMLWDIERASVGTIHSFAGELLREHALRFGIDPGFEILDERESKIELVALIREEILSALEAGEAGAALLLGRYDLDGLGRLRHQPPRPGARHDARFSLAPGALRRLDHRRRDRLEAPG